MNYIGSKYSLLPFLDECITSIAGTQNKTFCDLFAGTGIVGRYFKKKGYQIIANDLQYYSFVLNQQYIANHTPLEFKGLTSEIPSLLSSSLPNTTIVCNYLNSLPLLHGFIYNNFCQASHSNDESFRLYFSNENGAKCDAIRTQIETWKSQNKITSQEYYFLLATLLENIDKVANTASVYGAYLKKIKHSAAKPLQMIPAETILNDHDHQVFNTDANKLIKSIQTDILYLDPPYNQRQYAANYHVLETIARYDNPILYGKTGMRDYQSQKSEYCNKRLVKQAFADLIHNANTKYIFLSYNNEGLMSLTDIKDIMSQRGEYGFFTKQYNRFKSDNENENRTIKANSTIEYLHYVKIK